MDPTARSTAAERTLALYDRLDSLYRELTPLEQQYRAWAREYERTGVPHDTAEFRALLDQVRELRRQVADVRVTLRSLAVIGGAQ